MNVKAHKRLLYQSMHAKNNFKSLIKYQQVRGGEMPLWIPQNSK